MYVPIPASFSCPLAVKHNIHKVGSGCRVFKCNAIGDDFNVVLVFVEREVTTAGVQPLNRKLAPVKNNNKRSDGRE